MYLPSLSDDELVRHAENVADSLTQSDMERELLRRLEARVANDTDPLVQLAEEFELDAEELRNLLESHPGDLRDYKQLLDKLNECDIHTRDQLDEHLERARAFWDLAQDAGDVFSRLAELAAKTE